VFFRAADEAHDSAIRDETRGRTAACIDRLVDGLVLVRRLGVRNRIEIASERAVKQSDFGA
jgi:hypothetical protein